MRRKILVVFGTRPEAIKMAPLIFELRKYSSHFDVKVCVTSQHRQMMDQVLAFFQIVPDYDLNLMKPGQTLSRLTSDVISEVANVLVDFTPDIILVHGDTTTSFSAALAGFYAGCKIGHVEAGLRTYNNSAPFPEEVNRQITARMAHFHFAPTEFSARNLRQERLSNENIYVTGNTVIDALNYSVDYLRDYEDNEIGMLRRLIPVDKKLILVTGHRRENFGAGLIEICHALKDIVAQSPDVHIVYPVHFNPNVQDPVRHILGGHKQITLIDPIGYPAFVWLMSRSYLVLTDSGGIQEEAPSLGKPVLVMRETTERPEAVEAGTVKLVGTNKEKIQKEVLSLLRDESVYRMMSQAHNPYGDGKASERIVQYIINTI